MVVPKKEPIGKKLIQIFSHRGHHHTGSNDHHTIHQMYQYHTATQCHINTPAPQPRPLEGRTPGEKYLNHHSDNILVENKPIVFFYKQTTQAHNTPDENLYSKPQRLNEGIQINFLFLICFYFLT